MWPRSISLNFHPLRVSPVTTIDQDSKLAAAKVYQLSLSHCLFVSVCLYLFSCLSVPLLVCLCFCLHTFASVCVFLPPSVSLSFRVSLTLCLSPPVSLSLFLFLSLLLCLSFSDLICFCPCFSFVHLSRSLSPPVDPSLLGSHSLATEALRHHSLSQSHDVLLKCNPT